MPDVTYNVVVTYRTTLTTTTTKTISVVGSTLADAKVRVRDQMSSLRRTGVVSDASDVLTYITPDNIVSVVATIVP